MMLSFPDEMIEAFVAHARYCYPEEACGLVAVDPVGRPRMAYCLTNIDGSRYRYTLDPTEHFRAMQHAAKYGWEIGGVFHSHPVSDAVPSETDVAQAPDSTWFYVIVGMADPDRPEIRTFRIRGGRYSEIRFEPAEVDRVTHH